MPADEKPPPLPVRLSVEERRALEQFKSERQLPSLNYAARLLIRLGTGLEKPGNGSP